ncbi:transposable element Tc3 transposase [Trichonephila clavipes]|nr:transposable element Tc3 transposase [Trichonephila clavipes]
MATSTNKTAAFGVKLIHKYTFGDRLISRFGPVNWPPRSCDLTPLDYFLWGYVKSLVYEDKPQTLDHLEDNIRRVIADIWPQMLEKVIENWTSRLDYIRASRGSPMPEIIFKIVTNCSCGTPVEQVGDSPECTSSLPPVSSVLSILPRFLPLLPSHPPLSRNRSCSQPWPNRWSDEKSGVQPMAIKRRKSTYT